MELILLSEAGAFGLLVIAFVEQLTATSSPQGNDYHEVLPFRARTKTLRAPSTDLSRAA